MIPNRIIDEPTKHNTRTRRRPSVRSWHRPQGLPTMRLAVTPVGDRHKQVLADIIAHIMIAAAWAAEADRSDRRPPDNGCGSGTASARHAASRANLRGSRAARPASTLAAPLHARDCRDNSRCRGRDPSLEDRRRRRLALNWRIGMGPVKTWMRRSFMGGWSLRATGRLGPKGSPLSST